MGEQAGGLGVKNGVEKDCELGVQQQAARKGLAARHDKNLLHLSNRCQRNGQRYWAGADRRVQQYVGGGARSAIGYREQWFGFLTNKLVTW